MYRRKKLLKLSTLVFLYANTAFGAPASSHTFSTELYEVRSASLSGQQYLTVTVNDWVGPSMCRGSELRIDPTFLSNQSSENLENMALAAMLTSDSVVVTVSMENRSCKDGKPSISDMYFLPIIP